MEKICIRCKKKPATVVVRISLNGNKEYVLSLCADCAKELQEIQSSTKGISERFTQELMNMIGKDLERDVAAMVAEYTAKPPPPPGEKAQPLVPPDVSVKVERDGKGNGPKCRKCGSTFDEIMNCKRLGCPECLSSFRGELSDILKDVLQEQNRHRSDSTGVCFHTPEQARLQALSNQLLLQQEAAVATEHFEEAAALKARRDELEKRLIDCEANTTIKSMEEPPVDEARRKRAGVYSTKKDGDAPVWAPWSKPDDPADSIIRVSGVATMERYIPVPGGSRHHEDRLEHRENIIAALQADPLFKDAQVYRLEDTDFGTQLRLCQLGILEPALLTAKPQEKEIGLLLSKNHRIYAMVNDFVGVRVSIWGDSDETFSACRQLQQLSNRLGKNFRFTMDQQFGFYNPHLNRIGSGIYINEVLNVPLVYANNTIQQLNNCCCELEILLQHFQPQIHERHGFQAMLEAPSKRYMGRSMMMLTEPFGMGKPLYWRCREMQRLSYAFANVEETSRRIVSNVEHFRQRIIDAVSRAIGKAGSATLMSDTEAWDCLSTIWLGMDLGIIASRNYGRLFRAFGQLVPELWTTSKDLTDERNINVRMANAQVINSFLQNLR